jgi:chromosome segregation protein
MLQQREEERRAARRQPVSVGTQTDGGQAAKQMEEEHRSSLRAELTQHRAQLDSIRAQMVVDDAQLRRTRDALGEAGAALEEQRAQVQKTRGELRALQLQAEAERSEIADFERKAAAAQQRVSELEARIKELQGAEGTLQHRRVLVDALASVEAELGEKQKALQEAATQLGTTFQRGSYCACFGSACCSGVCFL